MHFVTIPNCHSFLTFVLADFLFSLAGCGLYFGYTPTYG